MIQQPLRPSDPRPGGVPFYITNECSDCNGPLILDPNNEGWMDEFVCPMCHNGVYLDLPRETIEEILSCRRKGSHIHPGLSEETP